MLVGEGGSSAGYYRIVHFDLGLGEGNGSRKDGGSRDRTVILQDCDVNVEEGVGEEIGSDCRFKGSLQNSR